MEVDAHQSFVKVLSSFLELVFGHVRLHQDSVALTSLNVKALIELLSLFDAFVGLFDCLLDFALLEQDLADFAVVGYVNLKFILFV